MGIIDTLSAGFGIVNKRLWLILLPILLDLLLWMGPRVTAGPLIDAGISSYRSALVSSSSSLDSQDVLADGQKQEALAQIDQLVEQLGPIGDQLASVNLVAILAWKMPSIMTANADAVTPLLGPVAVAQIKNLSVFLLATVLFAAGSLLAASLYLSAIAQFVKGNRFNPSHYLSRVGLNWIRLIGYYLLMLLFLFFLGVPGLLLVSVLSILNAGIGAFISGILFVFVFWASIYLFFVHEAIFISDVNPVAAVKQSVNIVRKNFWSALGLILLITIINLGTPLAWEKIMGNPWGAAVAIIGNAYIVTGLAAGVMIYFRDRIAPRQTQKAD